MPRLLPSSRPGRVSVSLACLLALALLTTFPTPPAAARRQQTVPIPVGAAYRQTNLVSDLPGVALIQDPRLSDPWAVARARPPLRRRRPPVGRRHALPRRRP